MKKSVKIIIGVIALVAILAIIAVAVIFSTKDSSKKTSLPEINSAEDLSALIEKVYEQVEEEKPMLGTIEVDLSDTTSVKSFTGLEDGNNFEFLSVSEPMINAIPYSLVIGKVKEGINANELAKEMSESIDQRKWICVTANDLYATSSGNCVFLVMGGKDSSKLASSAYESFKNIAQTVGKEYTKNLSDEELPPDTEDTGILQVPSSEQ